MKTATPDIHHPKLIDNWFERFVKKFGIIRSEILIIMVGWFPLAIFSYAWGDKFLDIGTHVKFLVSVPLFIITYPVLIRKLNWTLHHIQKTELVDESNLYKLDKLILIQDRITNSIKIKTIILILAFLTEISVYLFVKTTHLDWRSLDRPAGWWFHFVSQPLFYYVFFSFILRIFQWWQFMYKLSRFKLKLRAANGDQSGGLGFLSTVLNAFIFPAFAFSATVAAGAATLIVEDKMTLAGLQTTFISYCAFIVVTLITPLFFFFPALLNARESCIHKYGILVSSQLKDFSIKWFNRSGMNNEKLEVGDFSAVTDYGSEVNRVHNMRLHPLKLIDFLLLAVFVALPFLPVYSLEMPWKEIFKKLFAVVY